MSKYVLMGFNYDKMECRVKAKPKLYKKKYALELFVET